MLKNIYIPKYVWRGIIHNHLGFPGRLKMFGADTETLNGKPISIQMYDGKESFFKWTDKKHVLDDFINYFRTRLLRGQVNVVYFHNLQFDCGVLLSQYHKKFAGKTKIELTHKKVKIEFIIGKLYFGEMRFPDNKVLKILDTQAFFVKWGLEKIADTFKLPARKMDKPYNIGHIDYEKLPESSPVRKYFVEYATNDAVTQYHAGQLVIDQYKNFNTRVCVSLPQFSVRVFRHYFIKRGDTIKFPPFYILRPAILSYHGGKNGWYVNGVTVIKNCYEYDIVSAYPEAMRQLPNFLHGDYVRVNKYSPEYHGIYCITGTVKACKYAPLFDHTFKALSGKYVRAVWVTCYELAEALRMKEIKLDACWGYVWKEDREKISYNPFKNFVDRFFKDKSDAKTEIEKTTAKLILNSLYGKTIQAIENDEKKTLKELLQTTLKLDYIWSEERNRYVETGSRNMFFAGGMFNPFIATLITGYVRAKLHGIEHRYQALHSSTDSIKTVMNPIDKDFSGKLGSLKIECFGMCYCFRNKLYLHNNRYTPSDIDKFEKKYEDKLKRKYPDVVRAYNDLKSGKQTEILEKYALHGFLGKPKDLMQMYKEKRNTYTAKHIYQVKEALKQNLVPLSEQVLDKELHGVDFKHITYV